MGVQSPKLFSEIKPFSYFYLFLGLCPKIGVAVGVSVADVDDARILLATVCYRFGNPKLLFRL